MTPRSHDCVDLYAYNVFRIPSKRHIIFKVGRALATLFCSRYALHIMQINMQKKRNRP